MTETIPLYTTVCPVTSAGTSTATPSGSSSSSGSGSAPETVTTKITKVYTITSCAPTVTNCPVGKVTTEVLTSTLSGSKSSISEPGPSSSGTGALLVEPATRIATPASVATAASSIQQLPSTGVAVAATGVPSVATSAAHVASTGIAPSSTHKPAGAQTQPPIAALASPAKSVSKAVALVAGMLVAALFL